MTSVKLPGFAPGNVGARDNCYIHNAMRQEQENPTLWDCVCIHVNDVISVSPVLMGDNHLQGSGHC